MAASLDQPSSETFRALGDPVRCTIVEYLGDHGDTNVNDLAALFPISLQAVSKHIKVLQAAGVVSQRRDGRHRPVALQTSAVAEAADWLDQRRRQLETRYERLDEVLADLQGET
ncbi:MAG TPA: metalloregulator ArsR/SmtB family transcription factor [Ilumatobacteraceae bacterium]|nr:metalloregulator ArsR/SmtB family transcription factor [Ilumatobacteraceae bacterium]